MTGTVAPWICRAALKRKEKGQDMKRWIIGGRALVAVGLVAMVAGSGLWAQGTMQISAAVNEVDPRVGFTSVEREYQTMNPRYSRRGNQLKVAEVRRVTPGQTLPELEAVIGQPALVYSDGSLEFHLSLPLTERDQQVCQYRIFLDAEGRVTRGVWRRHQCAGIVTGQLN